MTTLENLYSGALEDIKSKATKSTPILGLFSLLTDMRACVFGIRMQRSQKRAGNIACWRSTFQSCKLKW